MAIERRFISLSEAAALLSLSVSGCRKLADRNMLPVVRIGRSVRVDNKKLLEQLEGQLKDHPARGRTQ